MTDVRYRGDWFPMDVTENRESRAADYQSRSQNVYAGCSSKVCQGEAEGTCLFGLHCVDLWRHSECRSVCLLLYLSANKYVTKAGI